MLDTHSTHTTRNYWHSFLKRESKNYMLIQDTPKKLNSNEIFHKSYNKTTKHGKDRSCRSKLHGKERHAFLQLIHLARNKRTMNEDQECTHHILMNHDASYTTSSEIGMNDEDTPNPR